MSSSGLQDSICFGVENVFQIKYTWLTQVSFLLLHVSSQQTYIGFFFLSFLNSQVVRPIPKYVYFTGSPSLLVQDSWELLFDSVGDIVLRLLDNQCSVLPYPWDQTLLPITLEPINPFLILPLFTVCFVCVCVCVYTGKE